MSLKNLQQQYVTLTKNLEKSPVKLPELRLSGIQTQKTHYTDHNALFQVLHTFKPIEGYVLQQSGKQVFTEGERLIDNFVSQGLMLFGELINETESLLLRQQGEGWSVWIYTPDYADSSMLYDTITLVPGTLDKPYNKMRYRRYWRQAENSQAIQPYLFIFQGFHFQKPEKGEAA
jgi:hypothetical protein